MTKVIIYNNEKGNVALMTPILTEINPSTGKTFTIEEVAAKDVPSGTEYKIVDTSTLPDDLTFFDAWKRSGETVTEDLAQSKLDEQDNGYARARQQSYPALGEQLDMLYHDMTAGKGDKTGDWYKAVKKIKDDNPKPS